ncbi:MAG TPA: SDR family oxidoreductase [Rhodobacteraceae bacterium]|nr:SDR family oxidoreductase [Paracoccaceae bacterium]
MLTGKVAMITGAASGIGLACATYFARNGARIIMADTDEKAGLPAAEALKEAGFEVIFTDCDVTERLDVRNMVKLAVSNFDRVDILVNNAGITHDAGFLDLDEEDFDRVLKVNLKGAFITGQCVARQMVLQLEEGGSSKDPGAIINMSSINAVVALPDQVPYCISKGGINQLTKVMALALAPYNIRVNAVGPGSVMTPMLDAVLHEDEANELIRSRTPLGRIARPEEIAAIAAFLATPAASYITGQTLYADGGRLGLNLTMPAKGE